MRPAFDAHADTAQRMLDLGERFVDEDSAAEVSLAKARRGGLVGQVFSVWVDPAVYRGDARWPRARALADAVHAEVVASGGALALARTGAHGRAAAAGGVFAALLGVEGAHALGADGEPVAVRLERLAALASRGVRTLSPTWSNSNDFGGSSSDEGRARGLSTAGFALVDACRELGIRIDVSHVSDPCFDDLATWARRRGAPLVATHSCARALAVHARNLTDAQLGAIAATGGIASVAFCAGFLDDAYAARARPVVESPEARRTQDVARREHTDPGRAALAAWEARRRIARQVPPPDVERVVDHIVHMLRVAGEDHVGLGSDFDGIVAAPAGLEDAADLPRLGDRLAARGLPARVVDKVFSENWLRVLEG